MFLSHVCLLLLAGCLTLVDGRHSHQYPDGEVVLCLPNQCDKPCPTIPPYCKSGVIKNCGCCDVCWIYLRRGEPCRPFVPENRLCGPHLKCGSSGTCEPECEENSDDSDNSSDNSDSSE